MSNFDPSNLNQSEMVNMMVEIKNLVIGPSECTKAILESAGFQKPSGSGQGPRLKQGDVPDFLLDFIQKKENDQISHQDLDSLIQNLIKSDEANSRLFIDKTA
jgi:hypothetical protein